MKRIIQLTVKIFIITSLFCSVSVAAEEEKKKSDKKPKKTPAERFQWLDKNKDNFSMALLIDFSELAHENLKNPSPNPPNDVPAIAATPASSNSLF